MNVNDYYYASCVRRVALKTNYVVDRMSLFLSDIGKSGRVYFDITSDAESDWSQFNGEEFIESEEMSSIYSSDEQKFISYPVFFGTNRKLGTGNEFLHDKDYKLYLGKCEVSIPTDHKVCEIERPSWFERLFFTESPELHFTILKNSIYEIQEFKSELIKTISQHSENDVLLFIHGYNVDFKSAMYRTAQLGYDLNFKGAVTAYSWPSMGKVSGYAADLDSSRLAGKYLSDYIQILLESIETGRLNIIAHSMGNVVIANALIELKKRTAFPHERINQIVLAAPDVDKDEFVNVIMPEINRSDRLTLYASSNDKALILSRRIRKNIIRLGDSKEITILSGMDSIDASEVDTSFLGHGYFSETKEMLNDLYLLLQDQNPKQRNLRSKFIANIPQPYWLI